MNETNNAVSTEEAVIPESDSPETTQNNSDKSDVPEDAYNVTKEWDFAQEVFTLTANVNPYGDEPTMTAHRFKKGTFVDEDARERGTPYKTSTVGKRVRGSEKFKDDFDDEPANVRFYDKTITKISGYPLSNSIRRYVGSPTDRDAAAVQNQEFQDLEDGVILKNVDPNELFFYQEEPVTFKSLIPGWQKTALVNQLLVHQYEIEVGNKHFALGAGRSWNIRQDIGGGTDENGAPIPPAYSIRYTLREPSEAERRKFRSKAISSTGEVVQGSTQQIRTTNLKIFVELFDAMVERVQAKYGDQAFSASDPNQLIAIRPTFKKFVVGKLFRALEIDLGN